MSILSLKDSNEEMINLIKKGDPFFISRLGSEDTFMALEYLNNNKINERYLSFDKLKNAGIYSRTKDPEVLKIYCNYHNISMKNSDCIASFEGLIVDHQNFYSNKYNLKQIHSRVVEPFYMLMEGVIPWTHYLGGKKILVINPFIESFKKQLKNNFKMFKDKNIFLDNQEFVFYKSFQTVADNYIHNDWVETLNIMCEDIKYLDFDIALVACGGYGLPICNYIKFNLGKSAVYVGGGLQLMFGVMGNRWENHPMWKKIIEENNCKFIKPSEEERCGNYKIIENGAYW